MDKTSLTIYLAIPMPSISRFEHEEAPESVVRLYDMLDEIHSLSGQLDFNFDSYGTYRPSIEVLQEPNCERDLLTQWFSKKDLEECEFVKISADIPLSDEVKSRNPLRNENGDLLPPSFADQVHRTTIRVYFGYRVSSLLIMANLCRVGSIELQSSVILQDEEKVSATIPPMRAWSIQETIPLAEDLGWPTLHTVGLEKAWKWMTSHSELTDALNGFGGTPVGRALAAFSRLFEPQIDAQPMQLLWALVGIEALYTKGDTGLLEQVREKSQVLLGHQTTHKKLVSQMYGFRSRFVHGDLDFPGLSFVHDAEEKVARYDDERLQATTVAIAILVATLQEMILRDWSQLYFTYAPSGTKV
jgi:hypothetical protein